MADYFFDEKDARFNMLECPGGDALKGAFPDEASDLETAQMIMESVANFAQKVLGPIRESTDKEGVQHQGTEVKVPDVMADAWAQYKELDVMAMCESSEYGGADLPHFFKVPVTEAECGSCVSFSMLPLLTKEAANLIYTFGEKSLKDTYVGKMWSGEWSGTMCLTEPQAGSDVGAATTKAEPHGDHFLISGTKIFITWGEHSLSDNIVHLVLARISGAPKGTKGLSLFVVPKFLPDGTFNDVVCTGVEHKMGIHASPTCVMNFGTQGTCKGFLVGEANKGMPYMFQMMNKARIEVGLQGIAQASGAYHAALAYARERKQGSAKTESGFVSLPIVKHPDIQKMLLNMRARVEGGRSMFYHLGLFQDLAHFGQEKERFQGLVDLLTPIAKTYGSDQGFRVAEWGVQVLGGYGFCTEYGLEQYVRDIKITSIYEGTNGIQALDLVFRKLMGSKGALWKSWLDYLSPVLESCQDSELDLLARQLVAAHAKVGSTMQTMGEELQSGNVQGVQFHATAFQESLSHIVVCGFLLIQAQKASHLLNSQTGTLDESFYKDKISLCRFYFSEELAKYVAHLDQVSFDPAVAEAFNWD